MPGRQEDSAPNAATVYFFGDFELDTGSFSLRRSSSCVRLPVQRKPFDVLVYLIEHRDRVVSKAELLEACWPREHVSDVSLPWSINQLRRALEQPRHVDEPIATVRGRGYRFASALRGARPPADTMPTPDPAQLLAAASVLGPTFDAGTLAQILGWPRARALEVIESLVARGALVRGAKAWAFAFADGDSHVAAYSAIPLPERMRHHVRAAEALRQRAGRWRELKERARHLHASIPESSFEEVDRACRVAAEAATRNFAHEDALEVYRWHCEAMEAEADPHVAARCETLLAMSRTLHSIGQREKSHAAAVEAGQLARSLGQTDLMLEAIGVIRAGVLWPEAPDRGTLDLLNHVASAIPAGETSSRVRILSYRARIPPHSLDRNEALALTAEAVALSRSMGGTALADALLSRIHALDPAVDTDELIATTEEALALQLEGDERIAVEVLRPRFFALLLRGDIVAADLALSTFSRVAHGAHLLEPSWNADRFAAQRELHRGRFAVAEAAYEPLLERAEALGLFYTNLFRTAYRAIIALDRDGTYAGFDPVEAFRGIEWARLPGYTAWSALAALEEGNRDLADAHFEQAKRAACEPDRRAKRCPWSDAMFAEAVIALGHRAEAVQAAARLAPFATRMALSFQGHSLGAVSRFLGGLHALIGDRSAARLHFEDAIARNDRMGLLPHRVRTELDYAEFLLSEPAGMTPARRLAERAGAMAQTLGMERLDARAASLLDRMRWARSAAPGALPKLEPRLP